MVIAMLVGGLVATSFAAPVFVNDVQAQPNTITTSDLLDNDFKASTGLGDANIKTTIGNIINVALGFLGIVAVVIILYGGVIWMTASGSQDKIKKAQGIIVAGAIGLAIILSAYAITQFVISEFIGATQTVITE